FGFKYILMKHLFKTFIFVLSLLFISGITSCSEDDTDNGANNFDRTELLTSLADNIILPNFENLQSQVNSLSTAVSSFNSNPNEQNLLTMREAWVGAVNAHQHCSAFGFGPANLNLGPYASVLGVFPVDEQQVETNISDAAFNLAGSFDRDIRGFYAVEYLIYGNGQTDAELIASFDQARIDYLLLITNELKDTFDGIVSNWNSGYYNQFISDNSTSAGSSISLLYNEWVKDYENLKNFKLELPAGLSAGQTNSDGQLVEAYYSGISRGLIVEHFASIKNMYLGIGKNGQDITGFQDYLKSVVGGEELVASTLLTIDEIDKAIEALPQGELSQNIDAEEIITLRNLLQANTANFKSSMSSLLGISITFNSGDGD
ncbi:MAG: imelysin family protein, partial [Fulvivirga sp.]|uniref:imelysin family protein n=1 Tax=Fulvivirga sp. TaxID=1931237 RepID=UPI0032EBFBAD